MSTVKKKKRPGRPAKYPPEFQADAVAMVLDEDRTIADVARSLGVVEGTLGNWVARERRNRAQGTELNIDERARLAELEHEVTELRMERDLLKRSLAFWVKESTP
jgi:transposase